MNMESVLETRSNYIMSKFILNVLSSIFRRKIDTLGDSFGLNITFSIY